MAGTYLQLRFSDEDVSSRLGVARVMVGSIELSHDCGTFGELEKVLDHVQVDLDAIRRQARARFEQKAANLRMGNL